MPAMKACIASGGGGGGGTSSLFRTTDGARSRTDGVECADSVPSSLRLERSALLRPLLTRLLAIDLHYVDTRGLVILKVVCLCISLPMR